eukprot:TRINITY_DN5240_c0_g1_i1.p1 TRINITY_DN5240_c0_g1~~TRINITY_DN5240_c0_g1_i1.p1  ORF type:complete len:240 (+),score=59.31 TRINITY_DN5240_c0_g1_i1:16-735(+)
MEETTTPPPSPPPPPPHEKSAWQAYTAEDLKRTVFESTDSALRSARSLQNMRFHTLQDFIPQVKSQYKAYEDAFFKKIKGELMSAREHPTAACGVAVAAGLLLMPGPRRFLFRQTLGRLQSVEAQYVKAEKNIHELSLSVDLMKKESKKLLERAALAEEEVIRGHTKLKNTGNEIRRLVKSVYKIESQAADLMDGLRELPGRDALKLRAEVASMASLVKQQRSALDKRIMKISELGISV